MTMTPSDVSALVGFWQMCNRRNVGVLDATDVAQSIELKVGEMWGTTRTENALRNLVKEKMLGVSFETYRMTAKGKRFCRALQAMGMPER